MRNNEFILNVIAALNKQLSKRTLNEDLKTLDNSMYVKVVARLSKSLARRELNKQLKELNNIYVQVGANVKIDKGAKGKLQQNIKSLQKSLSDLEIGLKVSRRQQNKINTDILAVRKKAQEKAEGMPISFNLEVKKSKLISDIEYTGKRYSKLFKNTAASAKYEKLMGNAFSISDKDQLSNTRAELSAFTSELKANGLATQSTKDKWKRLIDRSKELFSAASVIRVVFTQARQAVSTMLELDTEMTNLYKVQDDISSRDQFSGLLSKWNKLAQRLSVTTKSLISGSAEWSKIGFNLDMSKQLSEVTAIFEKTAEISNEQAAKTLISGAQAFTEIDGLKEDDYIERVKAVGDKINAIGNKYAISSEGISEALQNSSAALKMANNDLNESIALITAGNKIFQSPQEISNMLKVSSARIRGQKGELEALGEDTEGMIEGVSKVQTQILNLTGNRVNIFKDDNETLKSTYEIVSEVGKELDNLSNKDQASLLEIMFGKQRMSAGASLLLNYEELEKIKKDSINSENSMMQEYNKYLESAEAHIVTFKEKLVETYSIFMSGDTIRFAADTGSAILDLVTKTDLLRHSLLAVAGIKIGKGITTIGATIASTVKQMNTLGVALEKVRNLPSDNVLRTNALNDIGALTKSLTEKNLKLLLSQKQLNELDKVTILKKHELTEEEAKAKLSKMGLTTATKAQSTANVTEVTTTTALKGAMTSLKASIVGVGASIKAAFLANPLGWVLMGVSTMVSVVSSSISNYNQKLEETRQKNIENANTAIDNANSLKDLYIEYTRLAAIQDKTTSQEEQFKTVVENITKSLGDKAEALKGLKAGTDEYTESLKKATKAELEGQYTSAKIGAKAAEDELKDKTWSGWSGSQITIEQNEQMKGVKEHMAALGVVKDILAPYEDMGINGKEWEPVGWDKDHNNMDAVVDYYNALLEARKKLVTADNADFLMSSDIYKDINTNINDLSESVEKYTKQKYESLKLEYMYQNGIASTKEELESMEKFILKRSGAGDKFKSTLKGYIAEDFALLNNKRNEPGTVQKKPKTPDLPKSFSQAWKDLDTTSSESLKNLKSSLLSLAESGNLTEETFKATEGSSTFLDQINESAEEAIKKINQLADDSKQLNSLKTGIGLIQKAYVAKRDNGVAGADSLSGMEGTFGDLKSWKKYKETLGSATSSLNDCKTAQNKLATEWVNSSNFLSNLVDETGKVDEATKQYYIDQLKELGIKNAQEVVDTQIANATRTQTDAYAALSDEQKKTVKSAYDLKQMTGEEIIALFGLADGSRNAKTALAELAWENTNWEDLSAQDTIDQLSKIAEMAGIAVDKLAGLNALKSDLANSGNGNGDSSYQSMLRATDGKYAVNEVKNKLNTKTNVDTDPKSDIDTSNLKGSGSEKEDTKKEFDWIEILLANKKKNTDDISKKIDDYQKQGTKNNLYKKLQKSLDDEIKANEKAKNYYLKKANKVKLSDSLKKKIRNGAIDISTLKGTVAENAEKYQTLYDKAQNAKETAKDLRLRKRDEKRNALDSKIENKNNALGVLKSTAEDLQSEIDLLETKGYSANAEHYKKLDKNAEKQKKNLKEQNDELKKYLDTNNIKKYSKEWYDVQKQMEENTQSVNDLTKSQIEWNNTVSEMPFNNLEKMHSLLTSIYGRYQKLLGLWKAQGKNKTQEQIKKQLFMSLDDLSLLKEEYSEKWNEVYDVLDDKKLSKSAKDKFRKIYESFQNGDISKKSFYSQIAELGISKDVFDSWDKLQEKLTDLNDKSGEILDTKTSIEEIYDELFDNFSNAIQDLIDKLNEVNEAKSKAIELEKLQQTLQNAKQNKTSFIYHEGYGFNYEADRESVNDAQNNLDDFYNQEQLDALNKILDWLEKNKDNFNFFDDNGNPIYATLDEAIEKAVKEIGLADADFVKGLSFTTDSQGQMKASVEPRVYKTNDNVNDKLDKVLKTKTSVEGIYDKLEPVSYSELLSRFNPNLVPYEPDAKWAKLLENTAPLLTPQMNLQTPDFSKLVMKNDTSNNDYSVNIEKVELQGVNDAQSLINELSNLSSAALQRAHRNR